MRTLSATLTAGQKASSVNPLCRLVLSKTGQTSLTYETERILDLVHIEEQESSHAEVLLDNSDNELTEKDVRGYTGTISYGIVTSAGSEYSACAPLVVIPQQTTSMQGRQLTCLLVLAGYFDMMREDKASAYYVGETDATDTVKDIFGTVAGATLSVFDHCSAYTVDWVSEDDLVDSFQPKDTFYVAENETRYNVLKKLLSWTTCVMRIDADGHIDVFVPTTS